jgi:hypothetical protein
MNPMPLRRLFGPGGRIAALLIGLTLVSAAPAMAQISSSLMNPLLIATPMRGSDVAYDPLNHVYLVVGAHGLVWGACADEGGNKVSSFTINTTGAFGQFPSVAYSPSVPNGAGGVGAFVVTWHEGYAGTTTNFVNTRLVSCAVGPLSAQQTIVAPVGTWWESRPAIAYSPSSGVFLTVWRSGDYFIYGARLDSNGTLIGSPFQISPSGVGSQQPSVAWNGANNTFGVLYAGFGGSGTTTGVSIVTTGGSVITSNIFNFAGNNGTYITDIAYNSATGRFVGLWYQLGSGTLGAEIAADGSVVATGLVSTGTGTYDGLGLAYNPVSGTFLLVGHGRSYNVWGAELNSRGARISADVEVTGAAGPTGSFYPLTGARSNAAQWDVSFAHNFTELRDQVIATSSVSGGASGSLGSAPPTQTGGGSTGGNCPGSAPFPGAVCSSTGGWVPGNGSTTPTAPTGNCPGSAPFPGAVCSATGGWVPGNGSTTPTTPTGNCPGSAPFPGAVCSATGGWVPGDPSATTGNCPGTAPFPGAVCMANGGWVPGSGSTAAGSCAGSAPFAGAVCVGNGWVPGPTSSCTTPDPFTAIGGGVCTNGGWTPKG